ncbi:repeat protein 1 [Scheffersomyces stipitis CBS 6054]|uniref:Repeat protein 1 n=1 Tax=Scheffersomyces stipitis (strain ATCC 58785 / CBS 6054 / NBRC 10063 / NRRL Y-11545) TaxID=322104 RepID=A3LZ20_PICST|nr:repeat protein 1 [Scheffersomyces stipitis CBS 6054]XP_001386293.2 repeat protein 1 [Scheffersomyces stipitis CBS 6054]ABN68080.2 repeat protein 1 [Scheffersomyces stipitis CBS 6054]ABN68264.2 repeat protein 1 [Scheffersomyces stipitis CBS 6054]
MMFHVLLYLILNFCLVNAVMTTSYSKAIGLFTSGTASFAKNSGVIRVGSRDAPRDGINPYFVPLNFYSFDNYSKLKAISSILNAAVEAGATGDILYLYNYIAFNGEEGNVALTNYTSNFKDEVCLFLKTYEANSTLELSETTADKKLSTYYKNFPVGDCGGDVGGDFSSHGYKT